ncbi:hypothetical protein CRE_16159 [Caenorhabditis remanei]|uniref:Domain of unknown function WSN domain-containing protein n=1 Tax=Caenorhabditis remanei TaxID=31234 RepID=E3MSK4_CAERE|nr:hypothetical protein CRE_16159 [Caenorhabditis remanei]
MNEAYNCANSETQDDVAISMIDLSERAGMLLRKLSSLQKSLQIAQQINSEVIPNLSSHLSVEDISKMKNLVTKLENNIAIILDGVSIITIDMETKNFESIKDFKTDQADNIKTFNCIKGISFWFDEVTFSAQSIIKLRDIKKKSQALKSVKTAFSAILESLKSLSQIRSYFESLKVGTTDDNKQLATLNEVSKPFGEAVTALVVGNNLLSKKSDFDFMIKTGYTIQSKIVSKQPLEVKSLFVKHWGDFDETTQNIRSLLHGFSELLEKFEVSGNMTLEDVGRLLNNLPILVDVDLMFDERLAAIELLKSNKPTPEETKLSDDFKKSLLELSKLDLKFSRFQKSLNSMSDTINKLVGMMSGNSSQVTATTTGGAAVESVSSWSDPEYIVCYAVLVVVAFIAFIVFWCCSPIKTIDYDALNTLEMENGLKKDEKEEENVKKGKFKVLVCGKQYKVFQKRMKEATDKQKQKLAGHSASGSSSATNTGESATPSGSTTNTENTVTPSGSTANVAGGSANPSGSGTNNSGSQANAAAAPPAPPKIVTGNKKGTGAAKKEKSKKTSSTASISKTSKKSTGTRTETEESGLTSGRTEKTQGATQEVLREPQHVPSSQALTATMEHESVRNKRQKDRLQKEETKKKDDANYNKFLKEAKEYVETAHQKIDEQKIDFSTSVSEKRT